MTSEDYRRALEAAHREYVELSAQQAAIDQRLAQLTQTIGSLTRLCHLTPTLSSGLTEACRTVLKASDGCLTALEVRGQLEAMGFDVSRYANELASIHTVLKRLVQSGEVRFVPRVNGKPVFEWMKPGQVVVITAAQAKLQGLGWLLPTEPEKEPKGDS
jgi:hypothetical protein